jgi:hypothetical protein
MLPTGPARGLSAATPNTSATYSRAAALDLPYSSQAFKTSHTSR